MDMDEAVRMAEDGEPIKVISERLGIPEEVLHQELPQRLEQLENSRYNFKTPNAIANRFNRSAEEKLSNGDVKGFFRDAAPKVAMELAKDAVMHMDPKIKQKAQMDVLDRAGYKPVQEVVQYNMYDRMTREELQAAIEGRLSAISKAKEDHELVMERARQQETEDAPQLIEGEFEDVGSESV